MALLDDGLPHSIQEIRDYLDEFMAKSTVAGHVFNIRKKLKPTGHAIVAEMRNRKTYYRHVILLCPPDTE